MTFLRLFNAVLGLGLVLGAPTWVQAAGSPDFVKKYPAQARALLAKIDLNRPGLAAVKAAQMKGDLAAACEALLVYYRTNPAGEPFRPIAWNEFKNWDADAMLAGNYTFQNIKGQLPRRADGFIDWDYIPAGGDMQFPSALTRMGHPGVALRRFHETGERKYVDYVYEHTADFILAQPAPAGEGMELKKQLFRKNIGWQTLNAALRVRSFIKYFYVLQQIETRDEAGLLLLLNNIQETAAYLNKQGGQGTSNWDSSEMESLIQVAVAFPEFAASPAWLERGIAQYKNILRDGIYPDGSQEELATHYGVIAMNSVVSTYRLLKQAGVPDLEGFEHMIRRQLLFYAWTMSPDGTMMTHGDSDNKRGDLRPMITPLAREFNAPEALYIATEGREGSAPKEPSSRFFNWSGFTISRNGYDKDSQWSAFNAGPLGTGHTHADQLALQLYNQRMILVAPGRYSYSWAGGWITEYFHSTRGQNTVMIDGADQYVPRWNEDRDGPEAERDRKYFLKTFAPLGENEKVVINPQADFYRGRTYNGYRKFAGERMPGDAVHERAVYYQRSKFWVVVDRITSTQPRTLEAFWHFHPDCRNVEILADGAVVTRDPDQGNLLILPIEGNIKLSPTLYKGQEKPFKQGWFSETFNSKVESYDAVYKVEKAPERSLFGWLLVPFVGDVPPTANARLILQGSVAWVEVVVNGETNRCNLPLGERPKLVGATGSKK
jgi:hypothetical protein